MLHIHKGPQVQCHLGYCFEDLSGASPIWSLSDGCPVVMPVAVPVAASVAAPVAASVAAPVAVPVAPPVAASITGFMSPGMVTLV